MFAVIAAERLRLADALDGLDGLDEADWTTPSLCDGWTIHQVAAHLNSPWSVPMPAVIWSVVRSGGIDRGFDRVAKELALRLTPAACVAGLRQNATSRFTPPGFGPEAPLTDVIAHGADMLIPLDRSVAIVPEALVTSLTWLVAGKTRGFAPKHRVDGLRFSATDLNLTVGLGDAEVKGPALSLIGTLVGRGTFSEHLDGPGAAILRARL